MNLPANLTDLEANLGRFLQRPEMSTSVSGVQFLKLDKGMGVWVYGPEATEVEPDSTWAVAPDLFKSGYVCWHDGKLLGEEIRGVGAPPVNFADLPQLAAPWVEARGMVAVCISGEDEGVVVDYTVNNKGGRDAVRGLIQTTLARVRSNPEACVPVITLGRDSYQHKKWGRVWTPELTVVNWTSFDDVRSRLSGETSEPEVLEGDSGTVPGEFPEDAKEETPAPERRRRRATA